MCLLPQRSKTLTVIVLGGGVVGNRRHRSHVKILSNFYFGPVAWVCRILRLHLCRGVRHPKRVSWYDTKQSDGEAPVTLEIWGIRSTTLLPLYPSPFRPRVEAPDSVLSIGQIELNFALMLNWIV